MTTNHDTKTTVKAVQVLLSSELDMFEQGLMTPDEYHNKTVGTLHQALTQLLTDDDPKAAETLHQGSAAVEEQAECIPGWLSDGIPELGEDDPA